MMIAIITIKEYGLELGDVHAIGFSYGAHVVGHHQRNITNIIIIVIIIIIIIMIINLPKS